MRKFNIYETTGERMTHFSLECEECKRAFEFDAKIEDLADWLDRRKLIQFALPYLTANERECLIMNRCQNCIDRMYAHFENDEFERG